MNHRPLAAAVTAVAFSLPAMAAAAVVSDSAGWFCALAVTVGGMVSGAALGPPVVAGWRDEVPTRRLLGSSLAVAVVGYVVGAALCLLTLVLIEGLPPHVGPDPVAFALALAYTLVIGLPFLLAVIITGGLLGVLMDRLHTRAT